MSIIHNIPTYQKVLPYGRTQTFNATFNSDTKAVSALAGDALDFYFPKGYIDLQSLALMFKFMNIGTAGSQALPKDTECMIDRLEVWLGDTQIHNINNYNQLFFILSTYAFPSEFTHSRVIYRNTYTNGRPQVIASLDGVRFCCDTWLGLLAKKVVLNTHEMGALRIRLTLAPSYITCGTTGNSYGLYDIYMKVRYYENYLGDLPKYLEFDDFKSVKTQATNYNAQASIMVNAKRIDYVLARTLFANHLQKSTALNVDMGTVNCFVSQGDYIGSWNILVNNQPVFKYKPDTQDAIHSLTDLFHETGKNMYNIMGTENQAFNRHTTCGTELGFINEKQEQVEISYVTEPSSVVGASTTACFPYLCVKSTSSIEVGDYGNVKHTL